MTQINRFGSWNQAQSAAGLRVFKRSKPTEELLADVRRVADAISQSTVSIKQYRVLGKHDHMTLVNRFGSWTKVLLAAGLNRSKKAGIADDALFENILQLWQHYGRQPRRSELAKPPSTISQGPYWRRFGSWMKALQCFVEYANSAEKTPTTDAKIAADMDNPPQVEPEPHIAGKTFEDESGLAKNRQPENRVPRRTPRDPGWKLRYRVLSRDNFSCRACGHSPANTVGVKLHVDHMIAWSNGGETVYENLQTLCEQCNLGKGDAVLSHGKTVT